jgi:ABC-type sugar transport system substrate-binding protein
VQPVPRTLSLLLDDPENHYQRLLLREADSAASRRGIALHPPEFAVGSSWSQVESVNRLLRGTPPDGLLVLLAGEQWTRAPFERLVRGGVPVALLNRIPSWVEDLRRDHPEKLVAGIAPRQEGVGEIQGHQALRLVGPDAFVMLVTGDATSAPAVARRRGFVETVGARLTVREVDGRWSASGAEKALGEWFRLGAERDRPLDLVVCQNDAMAAGARAALAKQAAVSSRRDLARVPLLGCDGTDEEGRAMVARGELAATVVMPPTTPPAVDALVSYWETGAASGTLLLEAASHPPVEALGRS